LVREINLLQPGLAEQDAIVFFLDRETAKIDRLMDVRRKQVERLHEQRTAVIHQAVTKGLDPHSKMKPSGIDWLGDVPGSWDLGDLKHFAHFTVGWTPPTGQDQLYGGDFPWCTIGDLSGEVIYETEKSISAAGAAGAHMEVTKSGSLLFSFKLSIGQVAFAGIDMFTNEAIASFPPQRGFRGGSRSGRHQPVRQARGRRAGPDPSHKKRGASRHSSGDGGAGAPFRRVAELFRRHERAAAVQPRGTRSLVAHGRAPGARPCRVR
jgi:restriction endonuclease S subunit